MFESCFNIILIILGFISILFIGNKSKRIKEFGGVKIENTDDELKKQIEDDADYSGKIISMEEFEKIKNKL